MEEGGRGKYPRPKYHAGKISTCATHLGVNRFNAVPGATYISMIMLKLTGFAAHLAGIEVGDLPFSYRLPNPKAAAQGGRGCDPEKHLRQCETGLTQGGGGHRTTSLLTPGASESSLSQRKMLLEGPARERTNWVSTMMKFMEQVCRSFVSESTIHLRCLGGLRFKDWNWAYEGLRACWRIHLEVRRGNVPRKRERNITKGLRLLFFSKIMIWLGSVYRNSLS